MNFIYEYNEAIHAVFKINQTCFFYSLVSASVTFAPIGQTIYAAVQPYRKFASLYEFLPIVV